MQWDVIPFERVWQTLGRSKIRDATISFIQFIEKKTGASLVYNKNIFPYHKAELADLFELAQSLHEAGALLDFYPATVFSDEPPLHYWRGVFNTGDEGTAGGSHPTDERLAFTTMLAEALERNIWFTQTDYFRKKRIATQGAISHLPHIAPNRFAGIPEEERLKNPHMALRTESEYLWIEGYSWVSRAPIFIPAQAVSGHKEVHARVRTHKEPLIRRAVTTGLATHPNRTEALLGGAMEIIERDAYMILWLNQLTVPRHDINAAAKGDADLTHTVEACARYRLKPHALELPTDAPAHAVCVVLEDLSGIAPRFSVGLKAHRNLVRAISGALHEALRARRGTRRSIQNQARAAKKASAIGHYDRIIYWAEHDHAAKLSFLIEGPMRVPEKKEWSNDTAEEHFARVTTWCRDNGYELSSVSFTATHINTPRWHIEMVSMPELQPIYYSESLPHAGGTRLRTIPVKLQYPVRTPFFTEEPHPFA